MSALTDKTANYLYNALFKGRPGVGDMVRFRETEVPCWRCGGRMETYYCEDGLHAVRCGQGCPGVHLVKAKSPKSAAEAVSGSVGPAVHGTWETSVMYDGDGNKVFRHDHRGCGFGCSSYKERGTPYCPNCGAIMDGRVEE